MDSSLAESMRSAMQCIGRLATSRSAATDGDWTTGEARKYVGSAPAGMPPSAAPRRDIPRLPCGTQPAQGVTWRTLGVLI